MKKLGICTVLTISVSCLLTSFNPLKAHADSVTLTLTGVGGQNDGADYVYPYMLTASTGTSAPTVELMCLSYYNNINFGESWTANVESISTFQEGEAAYLFNLANTALNGSTYPSTSAAQTAVMEAQFANWELFSPGLTTTAVPQADVTALLNQAALFASNPANASFYAGFEVYVPVAGSQPLGADVPQTFIGISGVTPLSNGPMPFAITPEPSSFLLLGSGLLGSLALLVRRKLAA